jgi:Copper type II ascorbate-dependent monooxygenase, C-terminal domain
MRPSHRFAASVLFGCCGCGGNDGSETAAPGYPVDLAPPQYGVQVQTVGRMIPAGADEEWCEVVALPGDPAETYLIGRIEVAMAPFSHHLIVSMATEDAPELDRAPLGTPVQCNGAHGFGAGLVTLAASAKTYIVDELPPGVGHAVHGGQRLVFDYHALNSSTAPVPAAHRLNLHRVDHIDKTAQRFGFYNQYIEIPPRSTRSFSDACTFNSDILVWALARHTHRRGTDFDVWWTGGARDGEHVWTSANWEQDIAFRFDEPVLVPAGSGFRWQCAFDNPTDETLIFGLEATDEMCILFGEFVAAGDAASVPPQSCYRFAP